MLTDAARAPTLTERANKGRVLLRGASLRRSVFPAAPSGWQPAPGVGREVEVRSGQGRRGGRSTANRARDVGVSQLHRF